MLRDVREEDLPTLFEHQRDADAQRMAAFPGREWEAFVTHWRTRVLAEPSATARCVEVDGRVAGYVSSWEHDGTYLIAYWFGKGTWGRGIATAAVAEFVTAHEPRRPLHAFVVRTNIGSIRVLEESGFHVLGPSAAGVDEEEELQFRLVSPASVSGR